MTLAETINQMIETAVRSLKITSASPGFTNTVTSVDELDTPDLEDEIKTIVGSDDEQDGFAKRGAQKQQIERLDVEKTVPTANDEIKVGAILASPKFTPTKQFSTSVFKSVGLNPANLVNLIKNPVGFGQGLIGRFVLPIVGVGIGIQIAKMVWEWMIGPGGPLDIRVKIIARDEAFAMLDRQTRQNTRIGDRQVIIQTFQGFRNFEGYGSTSTGELIRQNADRVLDIGLFDRAQGVMLGGK